MVQSLRGIDPGSSRRMRPVQSEIIEEPWRMWSTEHIVYQVFVSAATFAVGWFLGRRS